MHTGFSSQYPDKQRSANTKVTQPGLRLYDNPLGHVTEAYERQSETVLQTGEESHSLTFNSWLGLHCLTSVSVVNAHHCLLSCAWEIPSLSRYIYASHACVLCVVMVNGVPVGQLFARARFSPFFQPGFFFLLADAPHGLCTQNYLSVPVGKLKSYRGEITSFPSKEDFCAVLWLLSLVVTPKEADAPGRGQTLSRPLAAVTLFSAVCPASLALDGPCQQHFGRLRM